MRWIVLALLAVVLVPGEAAALPRYSAVYGQDCGLCHHDPTGGGLRTAYASQFLVPTELAANSPELDRIDPMLGDHLLFGADLRTLFVESEDDRSTQLQMQADLDLAILVDERTSIRIDLGQDGVHEAFGLAYLLPAQGWLRAGRFVPDYGWKFADHQLFARRFVPDPAGVRDPGSWRSTGLEVGVAPGSTQWTASLDDGGEPGDSWTASGLWRLNRGAFGLAVGASALRRELADGHRRSVGGHGLLRFGPVAWLGQWDEPRQSGRSERVITQELSFVVRQGWTLRATHGFHDPDRERSTGVRQRYGAGIDLLATPFFGVLVMANYDDPEPGADVPDDERWSADLVLHFLY